MVNEKDSIIDQKTRTDLSLPAGSIDLVGTTDAINILISEMGEGFYNYVNRIGLAKDPNLIVLSSIHNYFYDAEEMKDVKTVINLKELNKINRIKSLLQSHLNFLPQKSNFVGYFVDNNKINRYILKNSLSYFANKKRFDDIENSIVSRFPFLNRLYSILDLKTNIYLSERSVTLLLGDYGFKIMDMTERNGFTFFHAQKIRDTYN